MPLQIDSYLGFIFHRFRDMATYSLTLNVLVKLAVKPLQIKTWLLLTAYRKSPAPYLMILLPTHYDLTFSHNTSVTDRRQTTTGKQQPCH